MMNVQFILTRQANGSYTAVVTSPDIGGIKNIRATGVKFAGGRLTVDVAELKGSYSGIAGNASSKASGNNPGALLTF